MFSGRRKVRRRLALRNGGREEGKMNREEETVERKRHI